MFSQYQVTFVKYLGEGRTLADSSLMELQPSGFLEASINGSIVRFLVLSEGCLPFTSMSAT
jgi:hypothetical protein